MNVERPIKGETCVWSARPRRLRNNKAKMKNNLIKKSTIFYLLLETKACGFPSAEVKQFSIHKIKIVSLLESPPAWRVLSQEVYSQFVRHQALPVLYQINLCVLLAIELRSLSV